MDVNIFGIEDSNICFYLTLQHTVSLDLSSYIRHTYIYKYITFRIMISRFVQLLKVYYTNPSF